MALRLGLGFGDDILSALHAGSRAHLTLCQASRSDSEFCSTYG